jgi:hypothetical protein
MAAMVMLTVLACRPLDYGVLVGKNSRLPARQLPLPVSRKCHDGASGTRGIRLSFF